MSDIDEPEEPLFRNEIERWQQVAKRLGRRADAAAAALAASQAREEELLAALERARKSVVSVDGTGRSTNPEMSRWLDVFEAALAAPALAEPETCPTCGSDSRTRRVLTEAQHGAGKVFTPSCPDSFHTHAETHETTPKEGR